MTTENKLKIQVQGKKLKSEKENCNKNVANRPKRYIYVRWSKILISKGLEGYQQWPRPIYACKTVRTHLTMKPS